MARGKTSCYNHTRKTFFLCATKGAKIPMTKKIRIGVAGYGNLGRGVELAIAQNPDLELFGVFTRRDPRFPFRPPARRRTSWRTLRLMPIKST